MSRRSLRALFVLLMATLLGYSACGRDGVVGGSCAEGYVDCDGQCRNLETDRNHCGNCGDACSKGRICVGGVCSGTPDAGQGDAGTGECTENADCADTYICYQLSCVCIWPCKSCKVDTTCGVGSSCIDGFCIPDSSVECSIDGDCNRVQSCQENRCVNDRSCQVNGDCGTKAVCVNGICEAGDECLTHRNCPANQYCHQSRECRVYVP